MEELKIISMAKGDRRNGSINHERLIGSGVNGYGNGVGNDLPDLVEEDVWSAMTDSVDGDDDCQDQWYGNGHGHSDMNSSVRSQQWQAGVGERRVGGLSLAFDDDGRSSPRVIQQFRSTHSRHHRHHAAASAPVGVPDWPKILRVESADSLRFSAEQEIDDGEWMPPHEYLARENAASRKMIATSVLEGAGRTLKGRDMSRVRNTVWRQTGFFG